MVDQSMVEISMTCVPTTIAIYAQGEAIFGDRTVVQIEWKLERDS